MVAGRIVCRYRFGSSLRIFIALASLAAACSSDGGASVDVEAELTADSDVATWAPLIALTDNVYSGASGPPASLDPKSLGLSIAAAIDDVVAMSDDDFRDAGGISRRDLALQLGYVMGSLLVELDELAANNGRQANVDTTAYALELGFAIASTSASGPDDDDDLLGWFVASTSGWSSEARDDFVADLDAGDFKSAAERLVDDDDEFGPAWVIDAVERQLEHIVPADDAGYPRDDLRFNYRFILRLN
jgi:hypothetical protein